MTRKMPDLVVGEIYRWADFTEPPDLHRRDTLITAAAKGWVHPRIRAAINGYTLHPMHYTQFSRAFDADPLSIAAETRWAALEKIYQDGAVVIVQDVQQLNSDFNLLSDVVLGQLGRAARCHAYFTLGRYFGFKLHSDVNDIFVLQGAGSKTWDVMVDGSLKSLEMHTGDLLYVPKYIEHQVRPTADTESVHVSVTIENA
jgi:mannose-6-phosphate isomerase-like protein (cupin superfamily)